jgi:PST family polysaccharide transporter
MAFTANLVLMFALVRDSTDGFTAMLVFLATGAASTLAAYVVVIRQIGVRRIRLSGALQVLKASTAIFASSGIAAVITNSSALLLSLFASSAAVAFFTVAERVTNLGLGLMVPANQVLLPAVSRHLSAPDGAGGAFLLMRRACGVMAVFGVLACMAMIFLSPYLIPLIFGEDYKQSIVIAQLFGLSYPFAALNQVIAMYVLIPMRRENLVAKITIGGALCNLVAIFLLAPHFSGLGMAAARLISEVFVLAMFFVVLRSSGTLDSLLLMRTKKPGLN